MTEEGEQDMSLTLDENLEKTPDLALPSRPKAPRLAPRPVLAVLAVLALVCFGIAGALWQKNGRADDLEAARMTVVEKAKSEVATLLSYDYRTLDAEMADRTDLVTGAFKDEYLTLVREELSPAATEKKVVTRTDVVSVAVIDADTETAELLLFLNQVSATKGSDVPVLNGSRVRVTMQLVDGTWKVAGIDPV